MTRTEQMTQAYIEALYFTETGDAYQPSADTPLSPLCRAQAYIDCRNFLEALRRHPGVQDQALDVRQLGHDLWLTRNGHGCGYWDRPEIYGQELADWLTALATAMGGHDAEFTCDALEALAA